jgi:thiol-disulfide isomerase/thioredoxin
MSGGRGSPSRVRRAVWGGIGPPPRGGRRAGPGGLGSPWPGGRRAAAGGPGRRGRRPGPGWLGGRRARAGWLAGLVLSGAVAAALALALTRSPTPTGSSVGTRSPGGRVVLEPEGSVAVGQRFPRFTVVDAEGRRVTRDTLVGRPAIVWFTTTYCVPCQVGARAVAALDRELGGRAFQVLVLFVDPGERPSDLLAWRRAFGEPDWIVALDTGLASRVELRFLDTKYLLDGQGVVRDVDVALADNRYLAKVRRVVGSA